ncbi:MAG: sodium:solute symporter family protein, partial [Bacteroidota bacterium]
MNNLSQVLDITVFVVFFILSIVVGYRYRGKKSSFREYAVGNKKFSTPVLVATIVATWMSGSILFVDLEETYSNGLYYVIAVIVGGTGGLLITGRVIGPRMGKFLNNVSVPDVLGQLYGKHVQLITGIAVLCSNVGYIALQFNVISKVLHILFNYDGPEITAIAGTLIVLYSASGGVKAVTFTDVLQFFTFGTLLPILALSIWNNIADHSQVAHVLNENPLFSFREVLQWSPELASTLVLISYFIFPGLPPQLFQRMAMARDVVQVKNSITYSAIICLVVELCMIWIAILLLADNAGLGSGELIPYAVKEHTAWGLGGFVGVGVVALAMSTADSALNASAVIFANDVWAPLRGQQEGSLKVAQWATMGMGLGALLLALKVKGLLKLLLISANFDMPVVAIPMLMAIFGFQTSRRVALMAMGTGATVVLACLAYFKSVNSFFPGMLANLVVLLGAHYLLGEKGGWGNNPISGDEAALRKRTWQELFADIRAFDLSFYLERTLPMQEYFYSLFGFYIFTAAYTSFYLLPHEVMAQYSFVYRLLQYSVTILTTIFLAFPIWPTALQQKRFMAWAWPLTLCYAFFVVGGTMVVISGFATPQLLILMLNFIMAVLLLHWPMAVSMAVLGIVIVVAIARYFLKPG